MNNVPTTMFTPNKTDYIQEMKVKKGLSQTLPFEKIQFNLDALRSYELFSVFHTYFPLVISVNYQKDTKYFAFISYGHFQKDKSGNITGAHIAKQVVLVSNLLEVNTTQINGIPFEIKSIYGLTNETDKGAEKGDGVVATGVADDGET